MKCRLFHHDAFDLKVNRSLRLLLLVVLATLAIPSHAAANSLSEAQRAFAEGRFEEAAELYQVLADEKPADPRLWFNQGTAALAAGHPLEALDSLTRALDSSDVRLQRDTFYNSALAHYQAAADFIKEQSPREARRHLESAIAHLNTALDLDPEFADARFNAETISQFYQSLLFEVNLQATPPEGGAVEGGGTFLEGESISLRAFPQDGWRFVQWTEDPARTPRNANVSSTATFGTPTEPPAPQTTGQSSDKVFSKPRETVTDYLVPASSTTVTGHFIRTWQLQVETADPSAGTAGTSGTFDDQTSAPLKAEAQPHWAFERWEGEGIENPEAAETSVLMDADKTVTAHFTPAWYLEMEAVPPVHVEGLEPGTVQAGQLQPGSGYFAKNKPVEIMAAAVPGWEFSHWVGDGIDDPQSPSTTVMLDQNRKVTAVFRRTTKVILYALPPEGGKVSGAGDFPDRSEILLTAEPNRPEPSGGATSAGNAPTSPSAAPQGTSYSFERWVGRGIDPQRATEPETTLIVDGEHDIAAIFKSDDSSSDENSQDNQDQNNQDNQDQQNQQDSQDSNKSDQNQDPSQNEQSPDEQEQEQEQEPEQPDDQENDPEQPEPSGDSPNDQTGQQNHAEPQPLPGAMTREQAAQLLERLQRIEQKLPASSEAVEASQNTTGRDW